MPLFKLYHRNFQKNSLHFKIIIFNNNTSSFEMDTLQFETDSLHFKVILILLGFIFSEPPAITIRV